MTFLEAHLICGTLVLLDQVARALRVRLLSGALGHPVSLTDAVITNTIGDAACALTPMRIAGEPVRLASLLRAGMPATASFLLIAFEVVTMWPVIIGCGVLVGIWFAPEWLRGTAPLVLAGLARTWGWVVAVGVVSLVAWLVARRWVNITPRLTRRPWQRARVYGRRMPVGALLGSAFLGFLNLASRTAILPVLLATLPEPPPLGPSILGSFALLYSQLALPTPAGAGAVDLGLLAGAAGDTGTSGLEMLIWWRFYTTFIGVLAGGWVAARVFGWDVLRTRFKGNGKGKEAGT